MGLFSSGKEKHRQLLGEAYKLVAQFLPGREFSVPIEFRAALEGKLRNLERHIENTSPSDLGDAESMRELAEDLAIATLIATGRYTQETQRRFRTDAFSSTTTVGNVAFTHTRVGVDSTRPARSVEHRQVR
jgi:hypothetical protein